MPEAGFDQISKTGSRIIEYFNVFIVNHSAGMPHIGHFYNENSSYNFGETMVRIRCLFLCFDSGQHYVSPVCSAYSKRFVSPEKKKNPFLKTTQVVMWIGCFSPYNQEALRVFVHLREHNWRRLLHKCRFVMHAAHFWSISSSWLFLTLAHFEILFGRVA